MIRRALAIVAVLLVLLAVLALHALPAASEVPAVSGVVPAGEFVTVIPPSEALGSARSGDDPRGPGSTPGGGPTRTSSPTPRPAPAASASPSLRAVPRLAARDSAGTPQRGQDSRPIGSVTGIASWYRYVPGQAAAGPRLRSALGPGWRGSTVTVCASVCLRVTLSDFMVADRLVDLDSRSFAALAPLSQGLVKVSVTW